MLVSGRVSPSAAAVCASLNPVGTTNMAPSDLQITATDSGGLSLNEDGGNDAYLIADDGGAILGGLTALTAEVRFSMESFPSLSIARPTALQKRISLA